MAEAPNGRVAPERATDGMSSSMAEMKAAIRETSDRLAVRSARTVDHIELLFTTPSSAKTEGRDGGVVGGAKRVGSDARRTGLLRRAAIGDATVIAAALATRALRH